MVQPQDVTRILVLAVSCLSAGWAWSEGRIELFSPSGYAKDVRQVTVRFSAAMVALGDPQRSDPFAVDCEVPGNGRWVDERNWVYEFDYDVPGAVRCRLSPRADLRTLAGDAVQVQAEYAFHTGGPAILGSEPGGWGIDERQVFLLALDAVPEPDSIREHARCDIGDTGDNRSVEVILGIERAEILAALEAAETHHVRALVESASSHLPSADEHETRKRALERIVMLRCEGSLPARSQIRLIWGAGIAALNGRATTQDDSLAFSVRPEFTANVRCVRSFNGRCVEGAYIGFSSPIAPDLAEGIRLVDGNGVVVSPKVEDRLWVSRIDYPEAVDDQTAYRAELVGPITDIDGRELANASSFPQTLRLGKLPPDASFGDLRVVPLGPAAMAPVLLRRIEGPLAGRRLTVAENSEIVPWMRRVENSGHEPVDEWMGMTSEQSVFSAGDPAVAFALSPGSDDQPYWLAGVPLADPGFHVVELELPAAEGLPRRYVTGTVVVTDLAVHLHHAKESSVVWVTRLSDGQPVDGADVAITDACTGQDVTRAATDADGIARIPNTLDWREACADFRYVVSARKDGDLGLATSGTRRDAKPQPTFVAHAILDRALYQPGETVSMKLIVRRANAVGLVRPTRSNANGTLSILHYPTDERQDVEVDFAGDGTAVASFDLPANAKLGWRVVRLEIDGRDNWIGDFRVERFRVGAMRASIEGPEEPFVTAGAVPVTLSVQHLAGGAAASLRVTVRATVRPWLDHWEHREPPRPHTTSTTLDSNGKAHLDIPVPRLERKSLLTVEMDYQDANGQLKTAHKQIECWPAAIELVVETGDTQSSSRSILVTALGLDGAPAPGVPVEASIYHPRTSGYRRLPGGFRAHLQRSESPLLTTCSGKTDATGSLGCNVPPETPNSVFVEATGWDENGNAAYTTDHAGYWETRVPQSRWLEVDWERQFAVGETAPIAFDVPFADPTVLVTVHREGVLAAFVERVKGPRAVIDLPVRRNYAPNVSVSVLAIGPHAQPTHTLRPVKPIRVGQGIRVPGTAEPAYRLGTVAIRVSEAMNALSVGIEPDHDTYRTRDRARVRITVAGPDGRPRPDAEVALIAVDEGLLELKPNETWDILKAMMAERFPRVDTATSMQSLNPAFRLGPAFEEVIVTGSYVRAPGFRAERVDEDPAPRERFDALLFWRARLATNDEGTAEAEIPLNDLLTSFRIVAVATAGDDLFGTGEATIRTTQDLILFAGLPEVVREGDQFDAMFTVRNASTTARSVNVTARAQGLPKLRPKRLRLRGGQTREVSWPVTVPNGVDRIDWDVTAKGGLAADRMAAKQRVQPAVPVRVQQATLTQLAASRELPVKAPDNALPGRGGIRVLLQPSLADNLGAVREAMSRYRYGCLEQLVSVAVVLDDEARWSAAMESARSSVDSDGLLRFFPSAGLQGSPVLTAYVLTIADAAGKPIPDDLRKSMLEGLDGYVAGHVLRRGVFRAADSHLRRLTALAALARYGAADRATLDQVEVNVETLPTSALLDWIDTLIRVLPGDDRLSDAKDVLRTRMNLQGTTMGFSTEPRDRLWWLMVATDGNAARAMVSVLDDPDWRADLPRMMRGLFGRQSRGRWQTTVANAWGTVATDAFRSVFEADPIIGASTVRLGEVQHQRVWPEPRGTQGVTLPQPIELPWVQAQTLALAHDGTGAPWGMVEFRAAVPLTEPTERGYRIVRHLEAVEPKDARRWSRGDVAQVLLEVDADADMTWVVVEDPLPPGAVVLGSGLGGDSSILSPTHGRGDRWPVFTERDFDSYRAYYRYLPKGRTTLRYNVRYNTAGTFQLPPSRVEAMYAPEMHAELPIKPVTIR